MMKKNNTPQCIFQFFISLDLFIGVRNKRYTSPSRFSIYTCCIHSYSHRASAAFRSSDIFFFAWWIFSDFSFSFEFCVFFFFAWYLSPSVVFFFLYSASGFILRGHSFEVSFDKFKCQFQTVCLNELKPFRILQPIYIHKVILHIDIR